MSLGVNLLVALTRRAAAALDAAYDIEIVEMHHRMKVYAPSGTARMLGGAAAAGRGSRSRRIRRRSARGHRPAKKKRHRLRLLRGGTVVGDHSVIFAGEGERVVLTHNAEDRAVFAYGALKAAAWAHGPQAGPLRDGRCAGDERLRAAALRPSVRRAHFRAGKGERNRFLRLAGADIDLERHAGRPSRKTALCWTPSGPNMKWLKAPWVITCWPPGRV